MKRFIILIAILLLPIYVLAAPYRIAIKDGVYNLMLSDIIEAPLEYFPIAADLDRLVEGDIVKVYLSGRGGRVDGLSYLTYLFVKTKAEVQMIVTGNVSSAHAMLACTGDRLSITAGAVFMYHSYSTLKKSVVEEVMQMGRTTAHNESFRKFMETYCSGFVTKEEVTRILGGRELYLLGAEIKARFNNTAKYEYKGE